MSKILLHQGKSCLYNKKVTAERAGGCVRQKRARQKLEKAFNSPSVITTKPKGAVGALTGGKSFYLNLSKYYMFYS